MPLAPTCVSLLRQAVRDGSSAAFLTAGEVLNILEISPVGLANLERLGRLRNVSVCPKAGGTLYRRADVAALLTPTSTRVH